MSHIEPSVLSEKQVDIGCSRGGVCSAKEGWKKGATISEKHRSIFRKTYYLSENTHLK